MSGDAHKAGAEALTALLNQAFSALGEKEYAAAAGLLTKKLMISAGQTVEVMRALRDAVGKGAKVIVGGERHKLGHSFFEPTLLTGATQDMQFATRIDSQNGEDFLYVFHNRDTGVYILLNYNLIEQKVDTPLVCHGFSLFEAGELVCFRSQDTAAKHHAIQVWQTPYTGTGFEPPGQQDSFLHKVGNKDIVRGMAECHEVLGLINKEDTYANLYVDIVKQATDILDSFFWITN